MSTLLSPEYLANEIAQSRRLISTAVLLLEGVSDKRHFVNHVRLERSAIFVSEGKDNLLETLELLSQRRTPGVLAIADADFSRLDGSLIVGPNLLFTDHHDLEVMLLATAALKKTLNQYGSPDKIAAIQDKFAKPIEEVIFELAYPIGVLRYISLTRQIGIDFDKMEVSSFLKWEPNGCNHAVLVNHLKDRSGLIAMDVKKLMADLGDYMSKGWDPFQVCCGHDIIKILASGLTRAIGSMKHYEVKPDNLLRTICAAYEHGFFTKTGLYKSIRLWEAQNPDYAVLH